MHRNSLQHAQQARDGPESAKTRAQADLGQLFQCGSRHDFPRERERVRPGPPMEKLLSVSELSGLLNCSSDFIYGLTYRREIPFIRLGRAIRFDPLKISRWIEERSQQAGGWGPR